MISIPSLTHQQLILLRLTKKYPERSIHISYESPVINKRELPINHPPFIQRLIDESLIQVQVKRSVLSASKLQREDWTEFCKDIGFPTQKNWELWRARFIAQKKGEIDPLMTPGNELEEFSTVWIRLISIQAIQISD